MLRILFMLFILLNVAAVSAQTAEIIQLEKDLSAAKTEKEKLEVSVQLGRAWTLYEPQKGKAIAQAGLKESERIGDIRLQGKFTNVLAIGEMISGDPQQAMLLYKKAISLLEKTNDLKSLEGIMSNLGMLYERIGYPDSALQCYRKCLGISIQRKDSAYIADNYINLGNYFNGLSQFDSSNYYFYNALKIQELQNNTEGKADALFGIGNVYLGLDQNRQALELFIHCRDVYDSLGVYGKSSQASQNIGQILFNSKKYNEAIDELNKVLPYYEKSENLYGLGNAYFLYANILEEQALYDSAYVFYQKSLNAFAKGDILDGQAVTLSSMGIMLKNQNKPDEAIVLFRESLKIKEALGDIESIGFIKHGLAECYFSKGQVPLALSYSKESVAKLEEAGSMSHLPQSYRFLAELYEISGDAAHAHVYLKKHLLLRDSLDAVQNKKDLADLETKYKTQEEIHKNELLQQQNIAKDAELVAKEEAARKKSILLYASIAVVLLLLGLSVFIIRANRQRKKANELLSQRNDQIIQQNSSIRLQKEIIEEKQKEITDSINYAKRIQLALLAHDDLLKQHLPEHFVLFKPKDIVSGDFYWATLRSSEKNGNEFFLAVCDSTGHGVPGAFMSLLNISFLNEAINEKGITETGKILDHARMRLIQNISQQGQKDGMDGVLMRFNGNKISYSAAHNNPVLIRNGELLEWPADKMPVGEGERNDNFKTYEPELKSGDLIYLYTDGFADQFGGPKGKKFKYSALKQLLLTVAGEKMSKQQEMLNVTFDQWRMNYEQTDDVCLIGIKIP